jgi:hypothetical protein
MNALQVALGIGFGLFLVMSLFAIVFAPRIMPRMEKKLTEAWKMMDTAGSGSLGAWPLSSKTGVLVMRLAMVPVAALSVYALYRLLTNSV